MDQVASAETNEMIVELTADVVAAYVSNNVVPLNELPGLIEAVHKALDNTTSPAEPAIAEKPQPAVPVKKSLQADQIICLECGLKFKSLKRHLSTNHATTPSEYREKWELSADYPMVAPTYAEARSRLAKAAGLGQKERTGKRPRQ